MSVPEPPGRRRKSRAAVRATCHGGWVQLRTGRDDVILRALTARDAEAYASLLAANREHLTRLGDYTTEVELPASEHAQRLGAEYPPLTFGIYERAVLVGSIALVAVAPPSYGLGYWLAEDACGRGLATVALARMLRYARNGLGATDAFAGVTHGNDRSVSVLERTGFALVQRFDDYDRYHRPLAEQSVWQESLPD